MKRTVSLFLAALLCFGMLFSMVACGGGDPCEDMDQSGKWGAYYQAFRLFAKSISEEVDCLSLNYEGVEEDCQKKLYKLFFEYCDDGDMRILEGGISALYEMGKVDMHSNAFKDACVVGFHDIVWNEDGTEVTLSVSVKRNLFVDGNNKGGVVKAVKQGNGWKATVMVNEKELQETKVGAYAAILQYYMRPEIQIDPINNRFIALDPEGLEAQLLPGVGDYVRSVFAKQGMSYLEYTWEELVENGYIDGSRFTEGYHISFSDAQWSENGEQVVINSWMTKAELEALGGIFTLEKTKSGWEIIDVKEMVS